MSTNTGVSPSRQYRVIMMTEDAEQKVELVTLPATLINNPATVEIWYQKYVPEGHLIVDVEPVEEEPAKVESEPEHVGFGDSLDFTGEEPVKGGDEPPVAGWDRPIKEDDDESEEDDNGEPFISLDRVTPPKDEV